MVLNVLNHSRSKFEVLTGQNPFFTLILKITMFRYSLTSLCEGFNKCLKLKCGPTPFVINSKSINTSSVMKNDGDDETFNYAAPKRIVARGHSDAVRNFELKFLVCSTYTTLKLALIGCYLKLIF